MEHTNPLRSITLICCYNNEAQYKNLCDSLATQIQPHILLGIDNRQGAFSCCSRAFNETLKKVQTKYVAFTHQDILFTHPEQLTRLVGFLDRIGPQDVLGLAGSRFDAVGTVGNVYCSDRKNQYGPHRVRDLEPCDTVDECFFAGYTQHFREFPFNEALCDGWHLYSVEACLNTKRAGHRVYVCDVPLVHCSGGNPDKAFYADFYALCREYAPTFPFLRTTCTQGYTHLPGRICKRIEGALRCTAFGKGLRRLVRRLKGCRD